MRRNQRAGNKQALQRNPTQVDDYILAYVFAESVFYPKLAAQLIENTPRRKRQRRKGHGLCIALNDTAKAITPGTYTDRLDGAVATQLRALGAPGFFARTAGAGVGLGVKLAMSHTPVAKVATGLRVLVSLVCPDLAACPAYHDVVNAYANKMVADHLMAFEEAARDSVLAR